VSLLKLIERLVLEQEADFSPFLHQTLSHHVAQQFGVWVTDEDSTLAFPSSSLHILLEKYPKNLEE
jgi:hypothetical protein